jgi:hypothetical protein
MRGQCLRWVIRVISSVRQPLPVCPQLRTLATRRGAVVWPRREGQEETTRSRPSTVDGHFARRAARSCGRGALRRYWSRHLRSGRAGRYEPARTTRTGLCKTAGLLRRKARLIAAG